MNGQGAGLSAVPGPGLQESVSLSLDGWDSLRYGCGANLLRRNKLQVGRKFNDFVRISRDARALSW